MGLRKGAHARVVGLMSGFEVFCVFIGAVIVMCSVAIGMGWDK